MSVYRFLTKLFLVASLAFLPSPAMADLTWKLYEFTNMTGGLNDSTDPLDITDREASAIQDIYFPRYTTGSFAKRPGFTRINSTQITGNPAFTGLTFYKLRNGTRFLVGVTDNNKIFSMNYVAGTGASGTWTDRTGSISFSTATATLASFAIGENTLIISDGIGTNAPYKWTGSGNAAALGGGSPASKYVEYHRRILFAAGDTLQPSRLYFSNLGDINTWTSTDFVDVQTDSSDGIIRGLKSGLDGLYIWKDSAIWRLSGTNRDDAVLERMVQGIGTLSHQSIAIVNSPTDNQQLFIFQTQYGDIAVYDGGVDVRIINHKVKSTVPNGLNFSRLTSFSATGYEFTYILSASQTAVSTNNRLYYYDLLHNAWSVFTNMNANAISTFEDANGKQLLMFGDYAGRANQWDISDTTTFSDPGTTAIDAFYETGWRQFKDAGLEKAVRVMRVFVNQQSGSTNLDVTVRSDFNATGTAQSISLAGSGAVWDTAVWDTDKYADLAVVIGRIEPNAIKDAFLFRFENPRAGETFRLRKFQVLVEPSGRV